MGPIRGVHEVSKHHHVLEMCRSLLMQENCKEPKLEGGYGKEQKLSDHNCKRSGTMYSILLPCRFLDESMASWGAPNLNDQKGQKAGSLVRSFNSPSTALLREALHVLSHEKRAKSSPTNWTGHESSWDTCPSEKEQSKTPGGQSEISPRNAMTLK